jgi:PAS domain S-box-containing protein
MTKETNRAAPESTDEHYDELRRMAERRVQAPTIRAEFDHKEQLRLIHELEVHQAELDIQNEELREANHQLAETTRRYKELFDFGPVGYLLMNENCRIREANFAAASLFQMDRSSLTSLRLQFVVSDEFHERLQAHLRAVRESGKPRRLEVRTRLDGKRWLELHTVLLPERDENRLLVTVIDIEERKRAEKELAREKASFQSLVENSPDIICRCTRGGTHLYVNPAFERITGISAAHVQGKQFGELDIPEATAETWSQALVEAGRTRAPVSFTFDLTGADGRKHHFQALVVQESRDAYLGIARDMTERLELESKLRMAVERADEANRAKSEFLANMSHEIRTPMNGVLGMGELLAMTDLDGQQQEYLQLMRTSVQNLLTIINDILDISRIEAGRLELDPSEFSLGELIRRTCALLRPEAERKNLELTCVVNPSLPERFYGDEGRLRQILFNLLGNAVKFTERGSVSLEVHPSARPPEPGHARLLFTVTDTGIGIDEDKQNAIFDTFVQADSSYAKKLAGTGLGLAIVKRLTHLFGGVVDLQSTPGQGTSFNVELELEIAEEAEEPEDRVSAQLAEPMPRLRVLLAEDNAINQFMATTLLERFGQKVVTVDNGQQVLDKLSKSTFDCVLMDVQMPVMDGMEATKVIRENPDDSWDPDIPVIALTAYAMPGDKEKFTSAGMDDYLPKPITPEDLANLLRRIGTSPSN